MPEPDFQSLCCECCGKPFDSIPTDISAEAPWRKLGVTQADFAARVRLTPDLCVIDEEVFLVRGLIELPIAGTDKRFAWGVWCSLSKASYERFMTRWNDQDRAEEPPRFGWLMSELAGYERSTWTLKTSVQLRPPGIRPSVEIEPGSHQIADEQRHGISVARWHELIDLVVRGAPGRSKDETAYGNEHRRCDRTSWGGKLDHVFSAMRRWVR